MGAAGLRAAVGADPRGCWGNHPVPPGSPGLALNAWQLLWGQLKFLCWMPWLEMDGTKSFRKWRRSFFARDFNLALSVRSQT